MKQKYDKLNEEKAAVEHTNAQILRQVTMMKDAIKDVKEREVLNIQLLEKNKEKA